MGLITSGIDLYALKFSAAEMPNVQERIEGWLFYLHGVFSDTTTFLFGHSVPPDRSIWTSAHNYYLGFIYNFGAIAVLAIIGLVIFTVIRLFQARKLILASPALLGLTGVVLFLIIPDNLLKVGMRQPYPGIITFFLWGLLLMRIESLRTKDKRRTPTQERYQF